MEMLNELRQQTSKENVILETFDCLTSLSEMNKFEAVLIEEEFMKAVRKCSCLGDKDGKEAVRRILHKVFAHNLALTMSWNGGKMKIPFKTFANILQFITVSVCTNHEYQVVPMAFVKDVIKRWLCNAADRNGGCNKRYKNVNQLS